MQTETRSARVTIQFQVTVSRKKQLMQIAHMASVSYSTVVLVLFVVSVEALDIFVRYAFVSYYKMNCKVTKYPAVLSTNLKYI